MSDRREIVPYAPAATLEEVLTAQFYAWERRGRGWAVLPYRIELEPPFVPFLFHAPPLAAPSDDARKPTFFSSLIEGFKARRNRNDALIVPDSDFELPMSDPDPIPAGIPEGFCEFRVAPGTAEFSRSDAEQFLINLSFCEFPISFEVIGTVDSIVLQLCCAEIDRAALRAAIQAYFPDASISEQRAFLQSLWTDGDSSGVVIEFGLSHEFMRPFATPRRNERDPLIPFLAALSSLAEQEIALLQVLFQRARYPWPESCLRAVCDWSGHSFFLDAPEMPKLTEAKISRPLFASIIRIAVKAPRPRAWAVAKQMGAGFAQFADPLSNELIPLDNADYDDALHAADLVDRQSRRLGVLLNSEELAALVHMPSGSIRAPKLQRDIAKTRAVPGIATGRKFLLGENLHQGLAKQVSVSAEQRLQHMYVIGASGTGKSTLLLNLIAQDLERGSGLAVLDPHGDLVEAALGCVPDHRLDDVIVFDPADEKQPVALNVLSAHSELEKNLLSSDLVAVFKRLSTSWGDQMTSVLGNAVLAFLESSRGGSLADLRRFLVEPEYRREFLETVGDPAVRYFWEKEFPLLAGRPQAPLLTRLDAFLRPKLIRQMVSHKESRLNFGEVMNGGKVFFAKLSQGLIGEENAYLLGSFLVSKFHQVAMSRQEMSRDERRPFYLYIDEFHNFITPSMGAILAGARKYGMGLILAHQDLRQMLERDVAVANAVLSNPFIRICFRLGDFDAKKLADGFAGFDAKDLQNLGVGESICRIERAEYDFNLRTPAAPQVAPEVANQRRQEVIATSRARYGQQPQPDTTFAASPRPEPARPARAPEKQSNVTPRVETQKLRAPAPPVQQDQNPQLGRGGAQHKYLQELVKRLAEARGFRAVVETPVLGGTGSVDVALDRGNLRIACEICVTSTESYELQNAHKCLAAGFDRVFVIAADRRVMNRLKSLDREFAGNGNVTVLLPDEFVTFLDEQEAQSASRQESVRGYKVKVKYKAISEEDKKTKKQAVSQVILGALRRLKD